MKNEEEYLKKRPYASVILMIVGFGFLSFFWTIFIIFGILFYYAKDKLTTYLYHVGVSLDYLLASMTFATKSHTISAIAHKRKYLKLEKIINWLFRDKEHCRSSYVKEYIKRKKSE